MVSASGVSDLLVLCMLGSSGGGLCWSSDDPSHGGDIAVRVGCGGRGSLVV